MIEVIAGILEKEGKVLIARRKAGKHLAGYWEFPGGKLESQETPEQYLYRELKEEFSISVKVKEFIAENTHHYAEKEILLKAYRVEWIAGEFSLKDHDKLAWVVPGQLADFKLAPADVPIVDKYLEYGLK